MKMLWALVAFLGLLPVLATGNEVQSFPARGATLSSYTTFKLLPTRLLTGMGVVENDPDVSPFILAALRKELTRKGLTEVPEGADLEVASGALAVGIPQVEALIFSPMNDALWGTAPITTIGRYNREGTLIVNLIDRRTNKSVWVGVAKRALGSPSSRKKDIDKAAGAMFKKYPSLEVAPKTK
jgi:Domain of unknown function (DUF4136)